MFLPHSEGSGDQFELGLFPGEPWGGHSPRALTRARLALIFNARADRARVMSPDPRQLDLFPRRRQRNAQRCWGSAPAPTLLPLPLRLED